MFIDTWIVLAAPPVVGALGFFIGVRFMAGKVSETDGGIDFWKGVAKNRHEYLALRDEAYARCSDSRNVLLARIDRLKSIAASQQSVKSGRIVAVLEGGE